MPRPDAANGRRRLRRRGLAGSKSRPTPRRVGERLEPRLMLAGAFISEFMAINDDTLMDSSGATPDWIEIYNPGPDPIDLAGWYLTDRGSNLRQWRFPAVDATQLDAEQFLVVFASGCDEPGVDCAAANVELHANFSLSGDGEYLALVEPDGTTIAYEFSPEYPQQLSNISYGAATTGETTQLVGSAAPLKAIVPADDSAHTAWTAVAFDDSAWLSGVGGVGYERDTGYEDLLGLDLLSPTLAPQDRIDRDGDGLNDNDSVYVRIPFHVDDPSAFNRLDLRIRADDGFVAYLNGDEVAELNAPQPLQWNSSATGVHGDTGEVMIAITYDANNNIEIFRNGEFYAPAETASQGALQTYASGISDVLFGLRHLDLAGSAGTRLGEDGYLAGEVNEARIYDTVLDPFQIEALFASGPTAGANPQPPSPDESLIHQWTFNGDATDSVGSADATLYGGAQLVDERLVLDGVNDYARTQPIDQAISARTMVVWVTLDNLDQRSGSAFTLENPTGSDVFDGIIYGERTSRQWMNGSNGFTRSVVNNGGALESFSIGQGIDAETIDLSQHVDKLVAGANVLAIQGLNIGADDSDLLVAAELNASRAGLQPDRVGYFDRPTPGAFNDQAFSGLTDDINFNFEHGFYEAAFPLALTSDAPDVDMRYTLDGSEPTAESTLYNGPFWITETSVVRVALFKDGFAPSQVATNTYIFVKDVLAQTNQAPAGAHWDTGLDPNVVNNVNQTHSVAEALVAIPTVSIVADEADLFGPNGIYANAAQRGDQWVRPGSFELFYPAEYEGYRFEDGFAINAGIEISGGASRFNHNPKHSFRVVFQESFGPAKLDAKLFGDSLVDRFDTLQLRTGHNQGWQTGTASSQYLRDRFAREVQLAQGQVSSHGQFVHLYLNGLYWGQYDLAERPDDSFSAQYFGGDKDEYDVIKGAIGAGESRARLISGNRDAWDAMLALAASDLSDPSNYLAIQEYLDIDNLIDYTISNIVTGEQDAPTCICNANNPRNFWATRRRDSDEGFRFFRWDAEFTLQDVNIDVTEKAGPDNPGTLHQALRANPDYRLRFADRVQQQLFNGGPLTPEANVARYERLAAEIDKSIVAESARWGDAKREPPFTRDAEWLAEKNRILNQYFPTRTQVALNQLRADGLFPAVAAPRIQVNGVSQNGGEIQPADQLSIQAGAGVIYYTLDGSDPHSGPLESTKLIASGDDATALVPVDGSLATSWTEIDFDDAAWLAGSTGIGFDRDGELNNLIQLDLLSDNLAPADRIDRDGDGINENDGFYVRIPFTVDDPEVFDQLKLKMRYDDGFVAYLNGQQVASDNAPDAVTWDSSALGPQGEDEIVMLAITYDENNRITIYRNGEVYATSANTSQGVLQPFAQGSSQVLFGRRHTGANDFLAGFIEEAQIWDKPLSSEQILSLYETGEFGVTAPPTPRGNEIDSLAHQWTFNDNAMDLIGSAHGVLRNGAQLVDGRLALDGINDFMQTAPVDDTISAKTLISWVSLDNLTQQAGSALTLENPTGNDLFDGIVYGERVGGQWMNGSNFFQRSTPNNGGAAETASEPIEVMMAIVYAPDNSITIYRDGQLYATANLGTLQTYAGGVSDVLIGLRHSDIAGIAGSPGGNDGFLAGFVNEARIYSSALSAADVKDIYREGPVGSTPPPMPVHHWTFSGDATDSVGAAHGSLNNGALINGGKLILDGVDDYVSTAALDNSLTTKTLVAWVGLDNLAQQGGSVLTLQDPTGADTFDGIVYAGQVGRQWMNGSELLERTVVGDNGGPLESVSSPNEVMLAITYAADGQVNLYRDGVLYASHATTPPVSYAAGVADVLFGLRNSDIAGQTGTATGVDGFLAAAINEAHIYDIPLTEEQIQSLFLRGPLDDAPPPPPTLLHQWTFEGDAQDQVGLAHGALIGGATVADGKLILDGINDEVLTAPLDQSVGAKTLVAWVGLSTLSQGGGSALTLQSIGGAVFDAIVYGERVPAQWMAGSNGFTRSVVNNGGAAETLVAGQPTQFQSFDISQYLDRLQPGDNVLAIHGLNSAPDDGSMLVLAELEAATVIPGNVSPNAQQYSESFALTEWATISARVLSGDQWSPLIQATFYVEPAGPGELAVTELNYHPHAPTPEELAINPAFTTEDFEFVELRNVGPQTVQLASVRFVEGISFDFLDSQLTTLAPAEHVLVVKNRSAFEARYGQGLPVAGEFSSGAFDNGGERVRLVDPFDASIMDFVYSDAWYPLTDGNGFTLQIIDPTASQESWSDQFSWRPSQSFGGSPGDDLVLLVPAPGAVLINEILSNSTAAPGDMIELYNATDAALDVSGWFLSDNPLDLTKYRLPNLPLIGAGDYLVLNETEHFGDLFSLPDAGGQLILQAADADGRLIGFQTSQSFAASEPGVSHGLIVTNEGAARFVLNESATFGAENSGPLLGPVVIHEIMYHPSPPSADEILAGYLDSDDFEFLEVTNISDDPVNLAGYVFARGIDFSFPALTLGPGEFALVVSNQAAFEHRYGLGHPVAGVYTASLANNGERVELTRGGFGGLPIVADTVAYNDRPPWPAEADGGGMSLLRVDPRAWGDSASNWIADGPSPGALGGTPPSVLTVSLNPLPDPADLPGRAQPTIWTSQRSSLRLLSILFSEPVLVSVDDLTLTNLGVHAPSDADFAVPLTGDHLTVDGAEIRLTFAAGELPPGVYRLALSGAIVDLQGNALDGDGDGAGGDEYVVQGDSSNKLYQLPGDFNGDGGVTIFDFPTFAYWFGQTAGPTAVAPDYVDLNGDGGISIFDFPLFAANFGAAITYPAALMSEQTPPSTPSLEQRTEAARPRNAGEQMLEHRMLERALREVLADWSVALESPRPALHHRGLSLIGDTDELLGDNFDWPS